MRLLNLTIRSGARTFRVMLAALPTYHIVAILALLTVRGKDDFKRIDHGSGAGGTNTNSVPLKVIPSPIDTIAR